MRSFVAFQSIHDHSQSMLFHNAAVSQSIQMQHQFDVQQTQATLQQDQITHHETLATTGKLKAILAVIFGLLVG